MKIGGIIYLMLLILGNKTFNLFNLIEDCYINIYLLVGNILKVVLSFVYY